MTNDSNQQVISAEILFRLWAGIDLILIRTGVSLMVARSFQAVENGRFLAAAGKGRTPSNSTSGNAHRS